MNASYVPRVTIYGDHPARTVVIAEAISIVDRRPDALVLGAMRPGYLGREVLSADDLHRFAAWEELEAQWADVEAGEQFAREVASMTPTNTRLTLDDLETAAWNYGGTITRANAGWVLVTRMGGAPVRLYAADETEVAS